MTTLTNCPHCGKPLVRSAEDLQPKALALLRLIGKMQAPHVENHALAAAADSSSEGGAFDRRLTGLKRRGLIERNNGRVSLTEAGRILAGPDDTGK
jgi:hypothetical protein